LRSRFVALQEDARVDGGDRIVEYQDKSHSTYGCASLGNREPPDERAEE